MNRELAEHISLLAAPILASLLAPYLQRGKDVKAEELNVLRTTAITQAQALWLDVLDAEVAV